MHIEMGGNAHDFIALCMRVARAKEQKIVERNPHYVRVVKKGLRKKALGLDEYNDVYIDASGTRALSCDCEDYKFRGQPCKHMMLLFMELGIRPVGIVVTDEDNSESERHGRDSGGDLICFG